MYEGAGIYKNIASGLSVLTGTSVVLVLSSQTLSIFPNFLFLSRASSSWLQFFELNFICQKSP
jgi:hypothetical protein